MPMISERNYFGVSLPYVDPVEIGNAAGLVRNACAANIT